MHMRILVVALMSCAAVEAGEWTSVESADGSLPVVRHEAGYVGVGDVGVLLGGRRSKPTNIFDFNTQTWSAASPPPIEMHHIQPVVRGGKVIIVGAMTGPYPNEFPVPYAMLYDPASDKWSRGFDIPPARLRGSTGNVLVGDQLYVACGIRDGHRAGHVSMFDVYDFVTKEWSVLEEAPRPRDHFAAAHVAGKIYLLGGRRSRAPKNTFGDAEGMVDVYDTASETWSAVDPIPTQRAGHCVAVVGDEILVIGGESMSQKDAHAEVEALDTTTGTWRAWPSLKRGRHGTGVVRFGDTLYIASGSGGRGGGPELESQEMYEIVPSAEAE